MIDRHTFIGHFVAAYVAQMTARDPGIHGQASPSWAWNSRTAYDFAERAWTAYSDERGRRSQLRELSVAGTMSGDSREPANPPTQEQA